MSISYSDLVESLRHCSGDRNCQACEYDTTLHCVDHLKADAADAIEALQAEVKRLQDKLCDWCAVCPKERRNPNDCELLGENPAMYGPSGAKLEVQDGE